MAYVDHENARYFVEQHLLSPFIRCVVEGTNNLLEFGEDNVDKLGEGEYLKIMNYLKDIRRHLVTQEIPRTIENIQQPREPSFGTSDVEAVINQANALLQQIEIPRFNFTNVLNLMEHLERNRTTRTILNIYPSITINIISTRFNNDDEDTPITFVCDLGSIVTATSRTRIGGFRNLSKILLKGIICCMQSYHSNRQFLLMKTLLNERYSENISSLSNIVNIENGLSGYYLGNTVYTNMLKLIQENDRTPNFYKLTRIQTNEYSYKKTFTQELNQNTFNAPNIYEIVKCCTSFEFKIKKQT
jgi:hypothetical protein